MLNLIKRTDSFQYGIQTRFILLTYCTMAPLTLIDKYDDLVRLANEPSSTYNKLEKEDFEDVISRKWPCIVQSITRIPILPEEIQSSTLDSNDKVHVTLARRLKIQFQIYSDVAKRYHQKFPNRMPIRQQHRNCSFQHECVLR